MRRAVQYFEPNFIDEALVLLDRFAPDARVLAGGTLLGLELRGASNSAATIVNVKRIPELRRIRLEDGDLSIGALATAHELSTSELVRRHAPLVAVAAGTLGARQLRNMATIGGNLCSGHPAADLSVALLASDAHCILSEITAGPSSMPAADFLRIGRASHDRRSLLCAVRIPAASVRFSYQKMQTRRAFEMALVAVAAAIDIEAGVVRHARIALGGASPVAMRATHAEASLTGKAATEATARGAARAAAEQDADPVSDLHASAEYRRHLVGVLAERALRDAFAAKGR